MLRKYDMIRAFDAGSYSYFFSASKGEILSFSHFWFSIISLSIFKNYYCCITELIDRSTIELKPLLP